MQSLAKKKNTVPSEQLLSVETGRGKVGSFDVVATFEPDQRAMQSAIAFLLGIDADPALSSDGDNENLPVC